MKQLIRIQLFMLVSSVSLLAGCDIGDRAVDAVERHINKVENAEISRRSAAQESMRALSARYCITEIAVHKDTARASRAGASLAIGSVQLPRPGTTDMEAVEYCGITLAEAAKFQVLQAGSPEGFEVGGRP